MTQRNEPLRKPIECGATDPRGRKCIEPRGHGGYHRALGHFIWVSDAMVQAYRDLIAPEQSDDT